MHPALANNPNINVQALAQGVNASNEIGTPIDPFAIIDAESTSLEFGLQPVVGANIGQQMNNFQEQPAQIRASLARMEATICQYPDIVAKSSLFPFLMPSS